MKKQKLLPPNKHVEQLKTFKLPVTSRFKGWYTAWRRRRKALKTWRHVATIAVWTLVKRWGRHGMDQTIDSSYFLLYERGDGKRRYEFQKGEVSINPKSTNVYVYVVVPWLCYSRTNQDMHECAKTQAKRPDVSSFE